MHVCEGVSDVAAFVPECFRGALAEVLGYSRMSVCWRSISAGCAVRALYQLAAELWLQLTEFCSPILSLVGPVYFHTEHVLMRSVHACTPSFDGASRFLHLHLTYCTSRTLRITRLACMLACVMFWQGKTE